MKSIFINLLAFLFFCMLFTTACHQPKTQNQTQTNKSLHKEQPNKNKIPDTLIFKDSALSALVRQTYDLLRVYDTIDVGATDKTYNLKNLKLVGKLKREIMEQNGLAAGDTIIGSDITMILSGTIADNLERILSWKDIDQYNLRLLFRGYIAVIASPDDRLFCFVFDEKTGGTYHSMVSVMHYNPGNEIKPQTFTDEVNTSEKSDSIGFNSDGYNSIDTINTAQGVKYVLQGTVYGCTTCVYDHISLMHFTNGLPFVEFAYSVGTRGQYDGDDTPIIAYDPKKHIIDINYPLNDQTPYCNCGKMGETNAGDTGNDGDVQKQTNVHCVYKFNGKTFVLRKAKVTSAKPN